MTVDEDDSNANNSNESNNNNTGNYSSDIKNNVSISSDDNKSDVNDDYEYHALVQPPHRVATLGQLTKALPIINYHMDDKWDKSFFRQQNVTQNNGNANSHLDWDKADADYMQ